MRSFYPPLSINSRFLGYLMLVKVTQRGESWKQGCDVTGDRTRTSHTEGRALTTVPPLLVKSNIFPNARTLRVAKYTRKSPFRDT